MKKCMAFLAVGLTFATALSGCGAKKQVQPSAAPTASAPAEVTASAAPTVKATATPNPQITHPEGSVLPSEEPGVEGTILTLTEETMDVKVGEETYHFMLGEKGKSNLKAFNKDPQKPKILEGTFVIVYYQEVGEEKVVESIEIVESN